MRIYSELDLNTFKAWSGAVSTLERIQREDKTEELEAMLEEFYPDGMSETELNDLLWFEPETVFEWAGLKTESQIREEISNIEEELSEKRAELVSEEEYLEELSSDDDGYYESQENIELITDEISELEEELEELKEELEEL